MPLIETLATLLGPAIAKAILKSWLKEGVLLDMASSLTEALKTPITDAFARERTADQFKAIGRQVAESLKELFESEGTHLDEEAQERIARALADTLTKATLSAKALLEHNLNSVTLFDALRTTYASATDGFAAEESAFYERLLKETCKYILDIAANLPAFQSEAFRVVIEKENELLRIAVEIRGELDRIRKEALKHNPEAQAREFEADYLQEVMRTQDEVRLFGTDLNDAQRRYRLSVAYVTLSVRQGKQTSPGENDDAEGRASGTIGPVDETLARSRRLLVRGLAGSGKTTLLQWLAVHSARHDFEGELAEWNNTIPFLIRLREFAKSDLPQVEAYPQLISEFVPAPPEGWVREQLKSGRALVLIDGIDEIPTARREAVRESIRRLSERFPARIIVTSRPHAVEMQARQEAQTIEEGWLEPLGFTEADLQPMDLENTLAFVDHWRDAVCGATTDAREKERLKGHVERLKQTIEERLPVRDLATSPLLCAMLCSLHRNKAGRIPTRRIELYEACVKMLLARDAARDIDQDEYPHLDETQKRRLLEHIAYWMLENGYSSASQEEVQSVLEPRIAALRLPEADTPERVLRLLVDRTGIVREPVRGQVDFAHRTFLEFLAAHAALDANHLGALLQNAHDDNFRETVILAVGLAKRELRGQSAFGNVLAKLWPAAAPPGHITEGEALIKGLLRRGDRERDRRPALHLLAVSCLETAVELSNETRKEVEQRLANLGPPNNIPQALAFASAGDMALPFLAAKERQSEESAVACVRALAHIGSPAALDSVVDYAKALGEDMHQELCRAWERFDSQEYARRVLSVVNPQTELQITNASSLKDIRYFVNLTTLDLSSSSVSDLSPLAGLTGLKTLNLRGTSVSDLSPLAALTTLTTLYLANTKVSDLSPLAALTNLTTLNLSGTSVRDLSPLAALTGLTILDLSYTSVSDLSPLTALTGLTTLNLSITKVTNLSPLTALTGLTTLYLGGLPESVQRQWERIQAERKQGNSAKDRNK